MKLLCCVTYKGTNYQGWQKQPDSPTIQGEIERVLSQILNTEITIFGSGRTDSGVHADNQYFHFVVDKAVDIEKLRYSANCLLPKDIFIKKICSVDDDFHARYSAKGKTYRYQIRFGERNPLKEGLETSIPYNVNVNLLIESLKLFEGEHYFGNFTSKEEDEDGFVRRIYFVECDYNEKTKQFDVVFKGNGFMRYQIRDMVGTALAVSIGKENLEYIKSHLVKGKIREIVSYKAQPEGLYLVDVDY